MIKTTVSYVRLIKKWTFLLLLLWVVVIFNSSIPGKIDGKLFPVVNNFEFVVEQQNNSSIVKGHFLKTRQCTFLDLNWFLNDTSHEIDTKLDIDFLDGEIIRNKGIHQFGPWRIYTPPDNLIQNSYVVVHHKCFIANNGIIKIPLPWTTITKIYP